MGKIELDHTGSGGGVTLSSDGTDLLLDGTAIGGGGGGAALDLYAENYDGTSTKPSATGTNAVAIGKNATATQGSNISIGASSDATGTLSSSFGIAADSAGGYSTALGYASGTSSLGSYSLAAGPSAQTAGTYAVALPNSYASGNTSFAAAISNNTSSYGATGANSIAMGDRSKATGSRGVAIGGYNAIASGTSSMATGYQAEASTTYAHAHGYQAEASGQRSWASTRSVASGNDSWAAAINDTTATYGSQHAYSVALGYQAVTTADYQIALGSSTAQVKVSGAYTLPTSDGTNGQVLTTDGSGAVTFADAGGGGGTPDLYADNYDGTSTKPSATGTNAFAIGVGAISSGSLSIALGTSNAYGIESFAAAIDHNSTTYGAGGSQGIAIGRISRAHGNQAIAIGSSANCSGNDAICIGESSQSSQRYSSILGNSSSVSSYGGSSIGYGNTINSGANSSVALGAENKNNSVAGKLTYAATNTLGSGEPAGSPKTGIQVIVAHTADATATVATTPTSSGQATASSDTIPALPNNSAYAFSGTIVARQQASQGTASAAWKVEGLIRREGSAGTTVLVNSATTVLDNTPGWGMALSADTTNGGLAITVTGAASTNIRWVATIHTSEVTYA